MLTKTEIVNAIHKGVLNAHSQFEHLSDGAWMADQGNQRLEGFVVSHIFRAISIHRSMAKNETPILELPFGYIKAWSKAQGIGRPLQNIKTRRRVDIALLNKQRRPIHVVEVKQKWVHTTGYQDVEKIRDILVAFGPLQKGSLKSVFLSVYWQGTNRPCLDDKLDELQKDVARRLKRADKKVKLGFHRRVPPPVRRDGKEWEYGSHIIELSRRNERK